MAFLLEQKKAQKRGSDMKITLLLILSIFSLNTFSFEMKVHEMCQHLKEDIPTQAGGRVKPYLVLANESIKFLSAKGYKTLSASKSDIFCSILFNSKNKIKFSYPVLVEHVDTKKLLGLSDDEKFISGQTLVDSEPLLRSEVLRLKENNSYKKDLNKLYNRLDLYKKIVSGEALTVFRDGKWTPISRFYDVPDSELVTIIDQSKKDFDKTQSSNYLLELTYFKSHIFSYCMLVVLIAIFLTVLARSLKPGVIVSLIAVLIQIIGMTMRVLISGRAPITNMYETVMFSGFGALVIALILLIFKKERVFLLAGLGYNLLCLFMMMFSGGMLSESISPLVPVLRDNFWLSTHVTTIILSYAALALTWLVANMALVKLRLGKMTKKDYRAHEKLIYTCMKVGIVLLAAGIILGGVWADYSWGRFWGWDPKETWSLIVLLFYMAIMHGKYSSWIDTHRFVVLSAAGFMTVMMAWFGVNYILAAGLHSYGFSEGGAIFLGAFFAIQIIVLIICGVKKEFKVD